MNRFMNDFFAFDKMISSSIIKLVFYLFASLDVLIGLFWVLTGLFTFLTGHGLPGIVMAFFGLMTMVIGPLLVRIVCEMLIVVFLIHDDLAAIRKTTGDTQGRMLSNLHQPLQVNVASPAVPYVQPMMRQE